MFWNQLAEYLLWIGLIGGLPVGLNLLYTYIEDQFIDYKKGKYSKTQKFVILRIFPPILNKTSFQEMESFFDAMWSIYKERTPYKLLTLGRSYENLTLEFHSNGGKIAIFVRINAINEEVLRTHLISRFPEIQIVRYPDPFEDWPKDWQRKGKYTQMWASDFKPVEIATGKETDLFPLKSWREFQKKDQAPIADPISHLFSCLRNLDPKAYLVIQFVTRPLYAKKQIDKWRQEYQARKTEFLGEAKSVNKKGKIISTIPTQRKIVSEIMRKIKSFNYLCKIRAVALAEEGVDLGAIESMVMSYFVQFDSEMVKMAKQKDTQTDCGADGQGFALLSPIVGDALEKIYWERERYLREKMLYAGLIKRNIDIGSPYYYLDTQSLATMIHFPYTNEKDLLYQKLFAIKNRSLEPATADQLPSSHVPANLPH